MTDDLRRRAEEHLRTILSVYGASAGRPEPMPPALIDGIAAFAEAEVKRERDFLLRRIAVWGAPATTDSAREARWAPFRSAIRALIMEREEVAFRAGYAADAAEPPTMLPASVRVDAALAAWREEEGG